MTWGDYNVVVYIGPIWVSMLAVSWEECAWKCRAVEPCITPIRPYVYTYIYIYIYVILHIILYYIVLYYIILYYIIYVELFRAPVLSSTHGQGL